MQPEPTHATARTKFITPGQLIEGTITEVYVNQEPFHCTIKILPKDPTHISAEGRYSDHEISLGKLKRNLVHLKYTIEDVEDIIAGVESLEGRACIFRVDKSGWISWIQRLQPIPVPEPPSPAPVPIPLEDVRIIEVFFVRHPKLKSIYAMEDMTGHVMCWAVGPTGVGTPKPRGWVLNIATIDEAVEVLKSRKVST